MERMMVRVIRNGVKFPYHGYCLLDPTGDPYVMHLQGKPEDCWPPAEVMLRKRRSELMKEGWRVVAIDLPDVVA